jgi:hypothetical protein
MPIHYKLLKVQYAFLITDDFKVQIRQKFGEKFPNVEVRIVDIEEYHTGTQANNAICDFWLSQREKDVQELVEKLDGEKRNAKDYLDPRNVVQHNQAITKAQELIKNLIQ